MEAHSIKRPTLRTRLASIFLLFTALFLGSGDINANDAIKPPQITEQHHAPAGVYYYRPGYMYYGPLRGTFWGGWRPYYNNGIFCQRNCVVDRWSGTPVRCVSRCLYE